jgi:predicted kinase
VTGTSPRKRILIPPSALVLLIGAAGSGKSTFAERNFPPEAVLSSDRLRMAIAGTEADQRYNDAVFGQIHQLLDERLAEGELVVVDATNTEWAARSELIRIAQRHHRPATAIVLHLPLELCLERNAARARRVRPAAVGRQIAELARDVDRLDLEGLLPVYVLRSAEEVDRTTVEIEKGPAVRAPSS